MKNILIAGAGNIGFWYLMAIVSTKIKANIFIYDNFNKQLSDTNQLKIAYYDKDASPPQIVESHEIRYFKNDIHYIYLLMNEKLKFH